MNYIIESNIDFYAELQKQIHEENIKINMISVSDNMCLLTNEPLSHNHITLECNHKFNYLPIYKEVCYQKLDNFLETTRLHINEIKCPYCRIITSKLLPYIELYDIIQKKKGVNFPAKYCMKLHSCSWTSKNKKICGCDAYKSDSGIYCSTHHKKLLKKQYIIEQDNNIEWTEKHKELNKKYKIIELKAILREKKLLVGGNKKQLIHRILQT